MTTLLNNKGLSKSEMSVAVEMELRRELERLNRLIRTFATDGSDNRKTRLMGERDALSRILAFMVKNMKKGVK